MTENTRGLLNTLIGRLGPDLSLAERSALFAAAASVGPSFEPGLPGSASHQKQFQRSRARRRHI